QGLLAERHAGRGGAERHRLPAFALRPRGPARGAPRGPRAQPAGPYLRHRHRLARHQAPGHRPDWRPHARAFRADGRILDRAVLPRPKLHPHEGRGAAVAPRVARMVGMPRRAKAEALIEMVRPGVVLEDVEPEPLNPPRVKD